MTRDHAFNRSVRVDDASLHVSEKGTGDPLVLLHGLPTSSQLWRNAQQLLAERYRTFAVDLLGCGGSDKPEHADWTLEGHAARTAALITSLAVGRVTLVGHDLGAAVALVTAARFPGVVARLALVCPMTERTWPRPEHERFLPPRSARTTTVQDLLDHLAQTLPPQVFRSETLTGERLAEYLAAWSTPAALGAFLELVRTPVARPLEAALAALEVHRIPTLVLAAEEDRMSPVDAAARLVRDRRWAEMEVVASSGHLLPEEAPVEVAARLRRFIERTPRSG